MTLMESFKSAGRRLGTLSKSSTKSQDDPGELLYILSKGYISNCLPIGLSSSLIRSSFHSLAANEDGPSTAVANPIFRKSLPEP